MVILNVFWMKLEGGKYPVVDGRLVLKVVRIITKKKTRKLQISIITTFVIFKNLIHYISAK